MTIRVSEQIEQFELAYLDSRYGILLLHMNILWGFIPKYHAVRSWVHIFRIKLVLMYIPNHIEDFLISTRRDIILAGTVVHIFRWSIWLTVALVFYPNFTE